MWLNRYSRDCSFFFVLRRKSCSDILFLSVTNYTFLTEALSVFK